MVATILRMQAGRSVIRLEQFQRLHAQRLCKPLDHIKGRIALTTFNLPNVGDGKPHFVGKFFLT